MSASGAGMIRGLIVFTVLAGCASEGGDVTGPFTGTPRRYVIDSFTLPTSNNEARNLGRDLNGDKVVDNQLGMTLGQLGMYGNLTTHAADMLASGAIASSVIIRANSLVDDATASVTYFGSNGDPATAVGGTFESGRYISNRTAETSVPGDAIARLPIFADADPSDVALHGLQVDLEADGEGGYHASFSGGVLPDEVFARTVAGLQQLLAADPDSHRTMRVLFDTNKNWVVSDDELYANSLLVSLLSPDVFIDDVEYTSIGFFAHLTPCDAGTCIAAPPADACYDRVQDGAESDVDCGGGTCRACTTGRTCSGPADCESNACDAGVCRAPTCSDGVRDGWETDVDCGGPCSPCALDARCWSSADCESATCGEPCPNGGTGCGGFFDFDTCRPAPPPP